MTSLAEYYLNSDRSVAEIDCIELSHPSFSKTFRHVRNVVQGVTVRHEDGQNYDYEYGPIVLGFLPSEESLDFGINVQLGDVGEIFAQEMDRIKLADNFLTVPIFTYRVYRSDNLLEALYPPIILEAKNFASTRQGVAYEARPQNISTVGTGIDYNLNDFPTLRGFL